MLLGHVHTTQSVLEHIGILKAFYVFNASLLSKYGLVEFHQTSHRVLYLFDELNPSAHHGPFIGISGNGFVSFGEVPVSEK